MGLRTIPILREDALVIAEGVFIWRCPRPLGFLWLELNGFTCGDENWTLEGPTITVGPFHSTYRFRGGGGQLAEIFFPSQVCTEALLTMEEREYVIDLGGPGVALLDDKGTKLLEIKSAWRDSDQEQGIVHYLHLAQGTPLLLAALAYGAVLITLPDGERWEF